MEVVGNSDDEVAWEFRVPFFQRCPQNDIKSITLNYTFLNTHLIVRYNVITL